MNSETDSQQNLSHIKQLSEDGDADSQAALGKHYLHGIGVAANYDKAFHWLHQAAQQDRGQAQQLLSILYASGSGVKKDLGQAVNWYELGLSNLDGGKVLLSSYNTADPQTKKEAMLEYSAHCYFQGIDDANSQGCFTLIAIIVMPTMFVISIALIA
jgi:TPR repeat protein